METEVPLFKIYFDDNDQKSISNVIARGSSWANGPEVSEFEEKISEYLGTNYSVTFNSGTSALHALLLASGIKEGDEVIVPSFTFIATSNAPLFVGAKPVFADIEEKTYGLNPEDVKEKITSKTKAIIPIHYGGSPCAVDELSEIADDYNISLFEDAAESFGANISGKKVGTFGNASILSFCQNKIITTGEGGAVTTNSKEMYEKLKLIRSHGRNETQDYFLSSNKMDYVSLGYNFRMSSISAALGISQIEKVDSIIEMRRKNAAYMSYKLSNIKYVNPQLVPNHYKHVYQMYTVRVNENIRDNLIDYLSMKGISAKIYFLPVHLTQFYVNKFGYREGYLPITEKISNEVLSLPIFPALTKEEINYIAEELTNFRGI